MTQQSSRINLQGTVATLAALACWSIAPVIIRYLSGPVDFWTQNCLRYGTALLFWLPYLILRVRRGDFDHRVWRKALVPGAACVVMQSFWASSLYHIEPAFMALLTKSSVLWIALLSMLLFADERRLLGSGCFWWGMALSFAGLVGVIVSKPDFAAGGTPKGIVFVLIAALLWAVYTVSARATLRQIDARVSFSVIVLYATLGLTILAVLFGAPAQCRRLTASHWWAVVVSGIFSIALAHVFFYAAIRRIGATIPSIILLASPFAVLAVSAVWFGETLNRWQWVFGLVLIAGSALAIQSQGRLRRC
ncbi:MAG: DMT family transporter [Alphaproteobacteria bacterium]